MSDLCAAWMVKFGERTYGPYSVDEMRAFAAERRLVPQSLVAPEGQPQFRRAGEEPLLLALFQSDTPATADNSNPVAQALDPAEDNGAEGSDSSHFVIMTDMKSTSIARLHEEIAKFGQVAAIRPQRWVLASDSSIGAVRHALIKELGPLDSLFIVDTTHDRAAWFNFAALANARIRSIWSTEAEADAGKQDRLAP